MRHVVRQVQEERVILVLLDELHGVLGVPGRELVLVFVRDLRDAHLVAFEQDQVGVAALSPGVGGGQPDQFRVKRPHVVRVGQAEVFIEPVAQGQKLRGVAEMPFAEDGGGVAALLDQLRQGHLPLADSHLGSRRQRAVNADSVRVAAREQSRARGGAHRLGHVEVAELAAFRSEPVQVWRPEAFGAEHADVRVALVVGEDDDNVRERGGLGGACAWSEADGEAGAEQAEREGNPSAQRARGDIVHAG